MSVVLTMVGRRSPRSVLFCSSPVKFDDYPKSVMLVLNRRRRELSRGVLFSCSPPPPSDTVAYLRHEERGSDPISTKAAKTMAPVDDFWPTLTKSSALFKLITGVPRS